MEYEIVKYRPEFKKQIVALQTYLWGPDVVLNTAYLEWKYEQNPYIKTPFIHLGVSRGQVIGMRGMYGAKWQIGCRRQTFFAPCAGDLVIAPEHRKRALVAKIMKAATDDLTDSGYTYVFSLSASLVTQLASLTAGWRSIEPVETARFQSSHARRWSHVSQLSFVRGLRHGNLVRSLTEKRPFYFLDRVSELQRCKAGCHVRVGQVPQPEAMAELVERIGSDGRLQQVRDQVYFAWRFRNPLDRYRFLFWVDTRLEGYLILQTRAQGNNTRVNIVDWEATNTRVRTDLLQAAIRWGRFDEMNIWTATLSAETKTLLQNAGFDILGKRESIGSAYRERARRPTVLIKFLSRETLKETDYIIADRRLLDLGNWDLRMIYSDNF